MGRPETDDDDDDDDDDDVADRSEPVPPGREEVSRLEDVVFSPYEAVTVIVTVVYRGASLVRELLALGLILV